MCQYHKIALCPTVFQPFFAFPVIKDDLFAPLEWKQRVSDVELYWKPQNFKNQTAFIQGYVVYYLDNNGEVIQVSTGTVTPC